MMLTEQFFLQGRVKLETIPHEMRMSHWVYAPRLTDMKSGQVLLDLIGQCWDCQSAIERDNALCLTLDGYPDRANWLELAFLPDTGRVQLRAGNIDTKALIVQEFIPQELTGYFDTIRANLLR
ncbi:hypothetical protein [Shewanella xiamenensis]|uniref:Uncharacterized protein n=1 Tax=Shewanella xiamenensis TaxID=332186 RepID=A0ABT6U922_9GAMM|nr:hypothetical protein [Shewanella xiamenensis]MDI5830955.1 hypothetical protein [Shewanella xiamenensis]MDL3985798.1 hypothetical protein [Shewanella xiamenensis]